MCVTFICTSTQLSRYGKCIRYDTSNMALGLPCDDLFKQGVENVFLPNDRANGNFQHYIQIIGNVQFVFSLIPQRCAEEAKLILCHYFFPPCGNSTVFNPPTSVCGEVCDYLQSLCPDEFASATAHFGGQPRLMELGFTMINCSHTGEYLEPLQYCCSDVDVEIRKYTKVPKATTIRTPWCVLINKVSCYLMHN